LFALAQIDEIYSGIFMTHEEEVTKSLSMLISGSSIIVELSILSTKKVKFKSVFVGFLPNQFILIQLPNLGKDSELTTYIKQGVACTIRSLVEGKEGSVIAFITSIEQIIKIPTKMLVLNIPKQVALQNLRKRTRIETQLNFETVINENTIKGILVNISIDGCLLKILLDQKLNRVEGDKISFSIPDKSFEAFTSVEGEICNVRTTSKFHEVGVKFEAGSSELIKNLLIKILMN